MTLQDNKVILVTYTREVSHMNAFKLGVNEIARMKMAVAIRATIKVSAKVIFRAMREMKNGAMWICYAIDGVKCSTFVKAASFQKFVEQAEISGIYANYVESLAAKAGVSAKLEKGTFIEIVKIIPDRIKDIKMTYQAILDEASGQFTLYVDSRKGLTYVKKFTFLVDLFAHIAK